MFLGWDALDVSKPSAFVALLDELFCILLQGRLKVTCSDNFANQGSWACMIFANPFMDFLKNIFGFLFVDAPQVGHGEASFVQGIIQDHEPSCPLPDLPCFFDVLWKPSVLEEG